ncbi:MAG: histidine kinase dimerization/phospho-acceptor domain-containing protein, partial [Acidobacteriota bacterium]
MPANDAERVRPAFETAVLLTSVVALLLPEAASLGALVGLILLWIASRPPRQERGFVLSLCFAVLLMLASFLAARTAAPPSAAWAAEAEAGFAAIWHDLAANAERAAASFAEPPDGGGDGLADFQRVAAALDDATDGLTLLLVGPYDDVVAWAGEGLLHDAEDVDLPRSGFAYRRGYHVSTVFAVAPIVAPDERRVERPWRLLAGRSLNTDQLPFSTSLKPQRDVRWSLGPADATLVPGVLALSREALPTVFVEAPGAITGRAQRSEDWLRRLGIGLLGLTLLALTLLRSAGGLLLPEDPRHRPSPGLPLLAVAGAAALGTAAHFPWHLTAAFGIALGLATWGLKRRRSTAVHPAAGTWLGGAAMILLYAAAQGYQQWTSPTDLAASLVGGADAFALCLVWCLAALGLLMLVAPLRDTEGDDRHAWLAALLLLAAGAACDFLWFAVPLLAASGAATVAWISGVDLGRRPSALAGLLVLAALAGSVSWESAYREAFRHRLEHVELPRLSPPTDDERNDLLLALFEHFEGLDFAGLASEAVDDIDSEDLAFVLWRDSPLAHLDALSALAIETVDGQESSFSFGLSLGRDLDLTQPPDRWNVPPTPLWNESMILGQALLRRAGREWGLVRYWLLPRPGFRLGVSEIDELEEALLRGSGRKKALDGLPRGVLYGLYEPDGRAITSPWGEAPPLDPGLLDLAPLGGEPDGAVGGERRLVESVDTPAGRAWVWKRERADGIEVLYLPQLTPRAALERVGIHALASLGWVVAVALATLVFALPWSAFRSLSQRTVRSYSKRMILVYTVLLLLPLIALNLVLLQSFADRQRREQLAAARSALSSARLFLIDHLRSLEAGFDLNTQVDRGLLEKIAAVVEHPVNFYWGNGLFASSQPELFTVGLLPRRIPGEIYARLDLEDYRIGFRQRRGDVGYLELYAPLDLGEVGSLPLFLSVPLLEQEGDVAREVAALQRRAVLVTSALVLLLFAVGSRLARSFTKPIMELIGGTRRIAEGAAFLDVTPREHELESLADAIDTMARRLAEGRRHLVLEKQVVERIVANITSGVVSLDHQRRVLLQNRVAADLLGSEIGGPIESALAADAKLRGVRAFLESVGEGSDQATVSLRDEAGEKREWTLTWVPIPGAEDPAALLVVEDATEVLRGQRLEAWAEMARIIAHEIKNPLTPIRLSADHMRQVYRTDRDRFDEVFERCTGNILKQVEELADIASDFSIYSRIPRAVLAHGDLVVTLNELVEGYRDAARSGVEIRFSAALS